LKAVSKLFTLLFAIVAIMVSISAVNPAEDETQTRAKTPVFGLQHNLPMPVDSKHVLDTLNPHSLPSVLTIGIGREVLCLLEILFVEGVRSEDKLFDIPVSAQRHFQILFRAIISPNAP
jgi:hypothetical protein